MSLVHERVDTYHPSDPPQVVVHAAETGFPEEPGFRFEQRGVPCI